MSRERVEQWRGTPYTVRPLSGSAGGGPYRCPGCDQLVPAGSAHVVAWPEIGDVADRRHWHSVCWAARDRRQPVVQRGRSAPRYGRG